MSTAVELAVHVRSNCWHGTDVERLASLAARSTLDAVGDPGIVYQISVLACDDDEIAELNRSHRNRPEATDILSWPHAESGCPNRTLVGEPKIRKRFLGDLAIAWTYCRLDADRTGRHLDDHVKRLVVHGVLHLLGHDHDDSNSAEKMKEVETKILDSMGIDHQYTSQPGERARIFNWKGQ